MTRLLSRLPLLLAGLLILVQAQAGTPGKVREYHLTIAEQPVTINGKTVPRITVNGQLPAPLLEFEEGEEAVIHVHNHLKNQDTSVHWHGLLLPGYMDGVPGFNGFPGIPPGTHFEYRFTLRQHGTYWYHAHSGSQEQDGLYGALIVHPAGRTPIADHETSQQDYVVLLSDFHLTQGDRIFRNLKKDAEYYQNQRETLGDLWRQLRHEGVIKTLRERAAWNQMRMLRTDLSDVSGYTFLLNGKPAGNPWRGEFRPGETVRLRVINASAMSFFDVRIPGLDMTVIAADGQPVQPVRVQEFRIGTAETYDLLIQPQQPHHQIEAESIDRSGFALGVLHQQGSPLPPIQPPTARPRALLTLADMGHGDHHPHHHHGQGHNTQTHPSAATSGWAEAFTPAGHTALNYRDLQSLRPQPDQRGPQRELEIRLGGSMERYIWTLNGKKFTEAKPWQLHYGERVRLTFINDSMMAHPMHLHGMFMQLENGNQPAFMPNKHTIIVPPGQTVSALLTANEPGEWAIHCHLLYHMSAGMMNKLIVAEVGTAPAGHNQNRHHDHHEPHDDHHESHPDHHKPHTEHHPHHASLQQHHAVHASAPADHATHTHGREHGNQILHSTWLDMGAYRNNQGDGQWRGELESRIGTDENRLFIKIHGHENDDQQADYRALLLYSRLLSEFWDIQLGGAHQRQHSVRNNAAVIGVHGLAPGFIETDLHLWLHPERQAITLEAERDLLLTQRWITQPYIDMEYVLNNELDGLRNGLTELRAGLQTRYEIHKRIRPFLDIAWDYQHTSRSGNRHQEWQYGLGLTLLF